MAEDDTRSVVVQIHERDYVTLADLATREWREPDKEASALIERALQAERRSNPDGKPRARGGRRAGAANGVAAVHS